MLRLQGMLMLAVALATLQVFVGCGSSAKPAADAPADAAAKEVEAAIAELPADERDTARQQAVCPVSDHQLGTMGAPIKVTHEGQVAFLCCEGCSEDFHKDPEKYLAKLKK